MIESKRYFAILGALIERERRKQELTQTELATKLDVHQSTVARIEAGKLAVDAYMFGQIARLVFDRSHASLEGRIQHFARLVRDAEEAVNPLRIPSRDAVRALIDYVVEVAA